MRFRAAGRVLAFMLCLLAVGYLGMNTIDSYPKRMAREPGPDGWCHTEFVDVRILAQYHVESIGISATKPSLSDKENGYLVIEMEWRSGDRVSSVRGHVVTRGGEQFQEDLISSFPRMKPGMKGTAVSVISLPRDEIATARFQIVPRVDVEDYGQLMEICSFPLTEPKETIPFIRLPESLNEVR